MNGRKFFCFLAISVAFIVTILWHANTTNWNLVTLGVWKKSKPHEHVTDTRDRNDTTVSKNMTSFRKQALEKYVTDRMKVLTPKRKGMKVISKPSRDLLTSDAAIKYVTDKKNTSSPFFIYSDEMLYSTIQRMRAEKGYTRPQNEICTKRVPKCIIIGVKKSGTRELIDFMSLHPNIVIKRNPYELGYFSKKKYSRNPSSTEWYRRQMPCSYSNQITVTKYPWYFSSPVAAKRIHNFNKTIKLIVLVREPVERLVSGYTFEHRKLTFGKNGENLSKLPPIERKLLLKNGEIDKNFEEVNLSSYDEAIKNYLKYFSLDQILFIELNEFKYNPHLTLKRVEAFLRLPDMMKADTLVFNEQKNFYCIKYHKNGYCYGNQRGRVTQPELSENVRKKLKNYFLPHNEHFFEIIGKRYDW